MKYLENAQLESSRHKRMVAEASAKQKHFESSINMVVQYSAILNEYFVRSMVYSAFNERLK